MFNLPPTATLGKKSLQKACKLPRKRHLAFALLSPNPRKEREIPLGMFWNKSPKIVKSPKNKRFSRRLKNVNSVEREVGNPIEMAVPRSFGYAIPG